MTEDEMAGWHHQLNGHEFKQALEVGDGQEVWRAAVHGVTKTQTSSVFPFFSASLNLSASVIYYDLEGVTLWGSITVQSVPY